MRYKLLYILVGVLSVLSAAAQSVTENIYIYRNDGKFNAFLSHEVDSLVYSNRDLKGNEYPEAVVQEVWTADSVYRIPLAVIDSISVTAPVTEYSPKVKKLDSGYLPYVKAVYGMAIRFSNDLPHSLRINKGDILLYEGFDEIFESGFAGKVTSISNTGELLEVVCAPVEITEIYDRFVAVGDYVVQPDPADSRRLMAVPIQKGTSLAEFRIPVSLNLDLMKAVSVSGSMDLSLTLKAVVNISGGHSYIDLTSRYRVSLDAGVTVGGDITKSRFAPISLRFPVIIPNIPILQGQLELGTFIEGSISGKAEATLGTVIEGGVNLTYEDGHLRNRAIPVTNNPSFNARIGAEGYVWTGILISPSIYVVGHIVDLGWFNGIGPYLDFDVAADLTTDRTEGMYGRLKDSNYSLSVRLASELRTKNVFSGHDYDRLSGSEVSFLKSTFHLLPEFSAPDVKTDQKSITVNTTARRDLLIPCEVGFRVLDEDGNVVDTWYSPERKNISTPELRIGHTFENGLKQGARYIVRPIIRLWGVELEATPEGECYLDCNVATGRSYATLNSFEATGTVESVVADDIEAGFMYTAVKTDPRKENARSCKAEFTDETKFKGSASGLQPGTTYYYCAYVYYDDRYYYGDTQCITTKKNIDQNDDDNFGGDYLSGSGPEAETGRSFDVERKTAKIILTFCGVSLSTECGYYLQADSKKGGTLSSQYHSLGTVTGVQTVELDNLIPGTMYRYWAVEKNSNGKSVASEKTFETEPSPDPVSKILEVKDIEMQSAIVSCYFENFEDAESCGIEYVDGEFTYKEKATPGPDGKVNIRLSKLTAETEYTVRPYVKLADEDTPTYDDQKTKFTTLEPDVLGWWIFEDNGVYNYQGPPFDVELRSNGRTNTFFGVNYLNWERKGRNILLYTTPSKGSTSWEFRGEFNEDYTRVTGDSYWVYNNVIHDDYEEFKRDSFYMVRNFNKND